MRTIKLDAMTVHNSFYLGKRNSHNKHKTCHLKVIAVPLVTVCVASSKIYPTGISFKRSFSIARKVSERKPSEERKMERCSYSILQRINFVLLGRYTMYHETVGVFLRESFGATTTGVFAIRSSRLSSGKKMFDSLRDFLSFLRERRVGKFSRNDDQREKGRRAFETRIAALNHTCYTRLDRPKSH